MNIEDVQVGNILFKVPFQMDQRYWLVEDLGENIVICIVFDLDDKNPLVLDSAYIHDYSLKEFLKVEIEEDIVEIRDNFIKIMNSKIREKLNFKLNAVALMNKRLTKSIKPERAKRLLA